MTDRQFFEKVLTLTSDEEMVEIAIKKIASLDSKNAKAKAKRMEVAKANEPIMAEISKYLADHKSALANELAQVCGVSTPKAVAMAQKLVDMGTVAKVEISIPKVGKRMSYSLVKTEVEETSNSVEALDRELAI